MTESVNFVFLSSLPFFHIKLFQLGRSLSAVDLIYPPPFISEVLISFQIVFEKHLSY